MAVKKTTAPRGNSTQVQAAAELLLQREEESEQIKQDRAQRQRRKRRRKRRREQRESVARMHRSIEVIKGCMIGICTVWVASFVVSIFVLMRVHTKVVEIDAQVNRIKHVMEHPFASAGSRVGADLDARLKEWFQLPEPSSDQR